MPLTHRTHVGVELRLTVEEADVLATHLVRCQKMVKSGVMSVPAEHVDPLLAGLGRLIERLLQMDEPFDEVVRGKAGG